MEKGGGIVDRNSTLVLSSCECWASKTVDVVKWWIGGLGLSVHRLYLPRLLYQLGRCPLLPISASPHPSSFSLDPPTFRLALVSISIRSTSTSSLHLCIDPFSIPSFLRIVASVISGFNPGRIIGPPSFGILLIGGWSLI